ncbi:hypothetical protein [Streptomyces sp. NPDC058486]|uniref:hypothetical protein n=1 Tax=unclassified Streptomyces TaxID=2593676 RepID=UPI00364EC5D4
MDMNDICVRADMTRTLILRLEIEPQPGRSRARLEGRWLAAWRTFESACANYAGDQGPLPVERAAELVRAAARAYESYQDYPTTGYLSYLYAELDPAGQTVPGQQVSREVEWAARQLDVMRAGLRSDFPRWLLALEAAVHEAVLTAP